MACSQRRKNAAKPPTIVNLPVTLSSPFSHFMFRKRAAKGTSTHTVNYRLTSASTSLVGKKAEPNLAAMTRVFFRHKPALPSLCLLQSSRSCFAYRIFLRKLDKFLYLTICFWYRSGRPIFSVSQLESPIWANILLVLSAPSQLGVSFLVSFTCPSYHWG